MAESSCKKLKRGHSFDQIRDRFMKHKNEISLALKNLKTDQWITFCFVKLLKCNGAYPCDFSKAWCETRRNLDDLDESKRAITKFPAVFDVTLVNRFMENNDEIESRLTERQLTAFKRLASFLEKRNEIADTILEASITKTMNGRKWALLLGNHVFRKLAVSNEMIIDSGCAEKITECPCGCGTPVATGDNSMGHKDVWHGSVDIILGPVAVVSLASFSDSLDESNSTFELNSGELEESRNQHIAETIVFSYLQNTGLVPTIGVSKKDFKVLMYDPEYDLLFESSELSLFDAHCNLSITAVLALWLVINHAEFCTGVKIFHERLDYLADFKTIVGRPVLSVYENDLKWRGCKHVKSSVWKFTAFENSGKYPSLD